MSINVKADMDDVEVYQDGNTITVVVLAPPPMNLADCIEYLENHIDPALRRKVETMDKLDRTTGLMQLPHMLGFDLRVTCNLLDSGCHEVVADIARLQRAGVTLTIFDTFRLTFDPDWRDATGTIYSVYHPDNCTGVILDIYQELITGNIGLALIERKGQTP